VASGVTIRVEGVTELASAFRAADRDYQKGIQRELKPISELVAETGKSYAVGQRLYRSGDLVDSIKPGVRGFEALVRDTASKAGFNYPSVYEGEMSGHGLRKHGPRPFLGPAIETNEPKILQMLDALLDRVAVETGFA
jgi:hypothetical protein